MPETGASVPNSRQSLAQIASVPYDHSAAIRRDYHRFGAGRTPLATTLAQAGMRTALIEREHVGGTCVNEGDTLTKTMVASGRVAYLARRAADSRVHAECVSTATSPGIAVCRMDTNNDEIIFIDWSGCPVRPALLSGASFANGMGRA